MHFFIKFKPIEFYRGYLLPEMPPKLEEIDHCNFFSTPASFSYRYNTLLRPKHHQTLFNIPGTYKTIYPLKLSKLFSYLD